MSLPTDQDVNRHLSFLFPGFSLKDCFQGLARRKHKRTESYSLTKDNKEIQRSRKIKKDERSNLDLVKQDMGVRVWK